MKFKFLLAAVNAKYIHSNPAIYSLRAYAGEELQQYVDIAEYTINQSMQEILADIYRRKPSVIGFSCYIWNWRIIQELLVELPKVLPHIPIYLGGPEVSYDPEVILLQYPWLAGIMIGEGEETFQELLDYYVEAMPCNLTDIKGLYLPSGYTPFRPLTNMNHIPFLYDTLEPFENKIIYYETSRGCPYSCSYCLSSIEKAVRLRDMDIVKKELQFFLEHKVKQVKFVDRTFNCNHSHAMAIWQFIYDHDNGVTNFHFEISADILKADEIALLRRFRPGLAQLEIGVQSVNGHTLEVIKRVMNVDKLEQAVAALQEGKNLHLHLDLIAGLPYEDYDSFKISFQRVYGLRPEQLQLGFLKVLKGSQMWERADGYGIQYMSRPPYEVLSTRWLSYDEILRLKSIEEMVELYYNSAQFTHTLPFLEKAFPDSFTMYEALADFYRQKGYGVISPARIQRYQILLEFAAQYDGARKAIYRELLTYDMYLRENMKSRPDFASELSEWKEAIKEFYRKEEKERQFLPEYVGYDWKQLSKMTHLEPFLYPVWDVEQMVSGYDAWGDGTGLNSTEQGKQKDFILFDYQQRNPLNYEAKVRHIRELAD